MNSPFDSLTALRFTRFGQRLIAAQPELADEATYADVTGWDRDAMQQFLRLQPITDGASLNAALRRLRARVLLRLAVRDLSGLAPLAEVHQTMSDLADTVIDAAHRYWSHALEVDFGVPTAEGQRQSLLVIGMGKLGGRELNVSSDIDLIFVYPEDGQTVGARSVSNQEFFNRLGQRIIAALDESTADGRAFRVDMRLRPWGDAGPLTVAFPALENYLIVHGREWERYAWIKARVVAGGDADSRDALGQLVRPFIYRKYLDFNTIGQLRSLHTQIRQEVARRELAEHVKLGPGGIREIEFIAQAYQLIRGGRDRELQVQPTLQVLRSLAIKNVLAPDAVRELVAAYTFLRRLEHRLQYLDDAQTHTLPTVAADRELIAQSMGCADYATFYAVLNAVRANVTTHFAATFSEPVADPADNPIGAQLQALWLGSPADDADRTVIEQLGFTSADRSLEQLRTYRSSGRYRNLPAASQTRVDKVIPRLIEYAARSSNPDSALERALTLLESVSRRSSYLALLDERRDALSKLTELVAASSWAATYLSGHPVLLDELLDSRRDGAKPDATRFAATLRQAMQAADDDIEQQMDIMREMHHAQVFRLLLLDLDGTLTIEALADHLSALADAVLSVTIERCWARIPNRHCANPRFAVIAYGKQGGKELGYASDLDLAFLFEDDDEAAPGNYAKLAQRMVTWLSSRTGAGQLFETDLRLRPDGEAGLLVTSIAGFRKYQRESAWIWEHQALTRARVCAGDPMIGIAFEEEREHILTQPRDLEALKVEVAAMRQKMQAAHPNRSGEFDVKHGFGGMIDIEFVVQFIVLAYARAYHDLTGNLGNIALLGMAARHGLIAEPLARRCQDAYREFRRIQHRLRLNEARFARVPFDEVAPHALAARELWQAVLGDTNPRANSHTPRGT
ncbi:MAG: bifunctional [glutamate--ammonia ligase]-adenylyl-L-tyrosine phosphorylase/[glutamate--ammonia-ligase] adenylyltransferase [Betaproteobacteria bacterium]|nr:bifunctional [glutamate--ammonia ligase]-adenylyl-L-tyrosine phosphorylase/[glutamate--ammonia-ligase] adenylyltransferase [Betaproteobacteria bacterium]